MKQAKPYGFPGFDAGSGGGKPERLPPGTHPLPMRLHTRATRAVRRRARGKHGSWLNREPYSLSGAKGRGSSKAK